MSSLILNANNFIGYGDQMPWYFIKPTSNIGQDKLAAWESGVPFTFSSSCYYPNNTQGKEKWKERNNIEF